MAVINPFITIIIINMNGPNKPIKRQRLLRVDKKFKKKIQKKGPNYRFVYKKATLNIKTYRL